MWFESNLSILLHNSRGSQYTRSLYVFDGHEKTILYIFLCMIVEINYPLNIYLSSYISIYINECKQIQYKR
jgi:hypothetical protein